MLTEQPDAELMERQGYQDFLTAGDILANLDSRAKKIQLLESGVRVCLKDPNKIGDSTSETKELRLVYIAAIHCNIDKEVFSLSDQLSCIATS
ncbi:hypothetical protein J6590_056946 [Homalodisca vitripennis]|nr:hypothetical protein J6590_056946 [Homalodisca vitripennis]